MLKSLRVLICGGRNHDPAAVWRWLTADLQETLNRYYGEPVHIACIIEGGALGADAGAHHYAKLQNIPHEQHKADWKKFSANAGPLRNRDMFERSRPDIVVGFPTGGPGTVDMLKIAADAGCRVLTVPPNLIR